MDKMKTIVAAIVLVFGMGEVPVMDTGFVKHILWAQNDTGEKETSESSKTNTETKKTESGDDEKDKASKSKPLKPFIPSEKIPGEQAVDFPVDI
jgi:hypothetical protein